MTGENKFLMQLRGFIKIAVAPRVKYAWDLFWMVVLYGSLLSFSLSQIFPTRFALNIVSILAWGIAFYFIKEEIPRIILKAQQPNRPRGGGNEE